MEFNYACDRCGDRKTNLEMYSFVCECGGYMRLATSINVPGAFDPYYDRVLGSWVTSEADKYKKMKKHKSESHPHGLYNVRDDKKFMAEMKNIQKHREDYKAVTHPGYKPRTKSEIERQGERSFDANRPDRDSYKRRVYSFGSR